MSWAEIRRDFPDITSQANRGCLSFSRPRTPPDDHSIVRLLLDQYLYPGPVAELPLDSRRPEAARVSRTAPLSRSRSSRPKAIRPQKDLMIRLIQSLLGDETP